MATGSSRTHKRGSSAKGRCHNAVCGDSPSCSGYRPAPEPPSPPSYPTIGQEIGQLVEQKQAAYGDSFGRSAAVLEQLYPNGIPVSAYTDALAIVRVVDKLFRIATDKDAFGESPWKDIIGYGLLSVKRSGDHK